MSTVYGSTEKLYPPLPSAPDESHIYRLKTIEEIEAFLLNEIYYIRNLNDILHPLE